MYRPFRLFRVYDSGNHSSPLTLTLCIRGQTDVLGSGTGLGGVIFRDRSEERNGKLGKSLFELFGRDESRF